MTERPGWPAVSGAATFDDIRRAVTGDFARNAAGVLRAGILPHSTAPLITAKASMAVDVAAFYAVIDRDGAVRVPNDGTTSVTLSAAPPTGSRYSVIYVRQRESTRGDGADGPIIDKVEHTSLTSARAALPPGALELGHVLVPAGAATSNASGVVITQTVLYTAMAGGTVLLRNQTEQNAWTPADGAKAFRLDTGAELVRTDGIWADTGWLGITRTDTSWNVSAQFGYRGIAVRRVGNEVWGEGIFSRSAGISVGAFVGSLPTSIPAPSQKTPAIVIANGTYIEGSLGDDAGANLNRLRLGAAISGNVTGIVMFHYFI